MNYLKQLNLKYISIAIVMGCLFLMCHESVAQKADSSHSASDTLWKVYWDEGVELSKKKKYSEAIQVLKNALFEIESKVDTTDRTERTKKLIEDCFLNAGFVSDYISFVKKHRGSNCWEVFFQRGKQSEKKDSKKLAKRFFQLAFQELGNDQSSNFKTRIHNLGIMKQTFEDLGYIELAAKAEKIIRFNDLDSYYIDDSLIKINKNKYSRLINSLKRIDMLCYFEKFKDAKILCSTLLVSLKPTSERIDASKEDFYFRFLDRYTRICIATKSNTDLANLLHKSLEVINLSKSSTNRRPQDELYTAIVLSDLGLFNLSKGKNASANALLKKALTIFENKLKDRSNPRYIKTLLDLAKVNLSKGNSDLANQQIRKANSLAQDNLKIGKLAAKRICIRKLEHVKRLTTHNHADWLVISKKRAKQIKQIPGLDDHTTVLLSKAPMPKLPNVASVVPKKRFLDWLNNNHPNLHEKLENKSIGTIGGALINIITLFDLPYREINYQQLPETDLLSYPLIAINSNVPEKSVARIRNYVDRGGYLISVGDSILTLRKAFPGSIYETNAPTPKAVCDAVYVDRDSPLSKGIPRVGFWHLNQYGEFMRLGFPGNIRVLVRSRKLAQIDYQRKGILAVVFKIGNGRVLHLINDLDTNKVADSSPGIGVSIRQALIANFAAQAFSLEN